MKTKHTVRVGQRERVREKENNLGKVKEKKEIKARNQFIIKQFSFSCSSNVGLNRTTFTTYFLCIFKVISFFCVSVLVVGFPIFPNR